MMTVSTWDGIEAMDLFLRGLVECVLHAESHFPAQRAGGFLYPGEAKAGIMMSLQLRDKLSCCV